MCSLKGIVLRKLGQEHCYGSECIYFPYLADVRLYTYNLNAVVTAMHNARLRGALKRQGSYGLVGVNLQFISKQLMQTETSDAELRCFLSSAPETRLGQTKQTPVISLWCHCNEINVIGKAAAPDNCTPVPFIIWVSQRLPRALSRKAGELWSHRCGKQSWEGGCKEWYE